MKMKNKTPTPTCPVCNKGFGSSTSLSDHLEHKRDSAHAHHRERGRRPKQGGRDARGALGLDFVFRPRAS